MGLNQQSIERLEKFGAMNSGVKMLELGCQNTYDSENYGRIAKHVFKEKGVDHTSIDLNGQQESIQCDLRDDLSHLGQFDVVTDYGTIEHVEGSAYKAFKNVHDCCRVGGIMIHELPKTGNWAGHGNHYFDQEVWKQLADANGYKVFEITEFPAMGNVTDGWLSVAVLQKCFSDPFMSKEIFDKLPINKS